MPLWLTPGFSPGCMKPSGSASERRLVKSVENKHTCHFRRYLYALRARILGKSLLAARRMPSGAGAVPAAIAARVSGVREANVSASSLLSRWYNSIEAASTTLAAYKSESVIAISNSTQNSQSPKNYISQHNTFFTKIYSSIG